MLAPFPAPSTGHVHLCGQWKSTYLSHLEFSVAWNSTVGRGRSCSHHRSSLNYESVVDTHGGAIRFTHGCLELSTLDDVDSTYNYW